MIDKHFLNKARDAKRGGKRAWSVMSTGEQVAVALALNKFEWLKEMGYTMAQAIDRAGLDWVAQIGDVERALAAEDAAKFCSECGGAGGFERDVSSTGSAWVDCPACRPSGGR